MITPPITSLHNYLSYLTQRLTNWTPQQHVALAAAYAERWLPEYESFSSEEEWGDPEVLRHSLNAVWHHVLGQTMSSRETAVHIRQIQDITPHMDDFDALQALMACVTVTDALEACSAKPDNTLSCAIDMALGVLENLVDEWPLDAAEQAEIWQSSLIQTEFATQLEIIEAIENLTAIDEESIAGLRERIASRTIDLPMQPTQTSGTGITNRMAFRLYRDDLEADLAEYMTECSNPDPHLLAMQHFSVWMSRYARRLQTINGSHYGPLRDRPGQQALLARNLALDAAESGIPEWNEQEREMIEMCLSNNSPTNLDAATPSAPHAYGPSMRRLWIEGRRRGDSNLDGWIRIVEWAQHRPRAWQLEDEHNAEGRPYSTTELGRRLAQELSWTSADDPLAPWTTTVDGKRWLVRINDFPDEPMYTLVIADDVVGDFHDWPDGWQRPDN